MIKYLIDRKEGIFFIILMLSVPTAIICLAYVCSDKRKCVVYGEEETKHGFVSMGKTMIPTTYKVRPCLVWEEIENENKINHK